MAGQEVLLFLDWLTTTVISCIPHPKLNMLLEQIVLNGQTYFHSIWCW